MKVPELRGLLRAWGVEGQLRLAPLPVQGHSSTAWLVETAGEKFVAKLIRDRRRYAEPGLRVADAVERGGVRTGAPVPTLGGGLCIEAHVDGGDCTLALLRFVPGEPLGRTRSDAAEIGGDLLGRVHAILLRDSSRAWVPNDLLEWCESHARTSPGADTARALRVLAAIRELAGSGALKTAVVYGDPTPEIIVGYSGETALVDWGTPSWGPLAHDLACWIRHVDDAERFLSAYEEHVALGPIDLEAVPLCHELGRALGL